MNQLKFGGIPKRRRNDFLGADRNKSVDMQDIAFLPFVRDRQLLKGSEKPSIGAKL